jgi:predicted dehydrogenase
MRYTVAIIGTGRMAQEHYNAFISFKKFNVVCVVGRNEKKLKSFANKNFIKNFFFNIETAYKELKPDLVIIAVSELSSKKVVLESLKFPWTCLAEKPIGYNYKQNIFLYKRIKFAKKENFFIALNRRHYSSTINAKNILFKNNGKRHIFISGQEDLNFQNKINTPKKVIDNFMYANSIHLIDYINIFCRGTLTSIKKLNFLNKKPHLLISKLNFSSGDCATYSVVHNVNAPWYFALKTNKLSIVIKPLETYYSNIRKINNNINKFDKKFKPGLREQARQVLNYLSNKKHNLPSIETYIKTINLIKKIYEK